MRAELEEIPLLLYLPVQAAVPLGCQTDPETAPRGYLTGVLCFGMVGGLTGLWGPHWVGGAALQSTVLRCCPSVVPAPLMVTKLSWVLGDITAETGNYGGAFPLFNDAQTKNLQEHGQVFQIPN